MKRILLVLLACLSFNAFAAVNVNTATQAELETLEGVGPVKAKAIIDYRKKNGDFKNIDELQKVDGIGEVTVKNIRKDVSLSGKTTVPAAKPTAGGAKKVDKETSLDEIAKENAKKQKALKDKSEKEKAASEKAKKAAAEKESTKKTITVGNQKAAETGKTAASKTLKEEKTTQEKDKPKNSK